MPLIYLVRHGRAVGGFSDELDPGLDDMGRTQGFKVMEVMKDVDPMPIYSSPLRRCQETAAPLARRWGVEPQIVDAVTEVPSGNMGLKARGEWLARIMEGGWASAGKDVNEWRRGVYDFLSGLNEDAIIFSHFVAINSVIARARGVDNVVSERLENGSITKVQVDGDNFEIVEVGKTAGKTRVR